MLGGSKAPLMAKQNAMSGTLASRDFYVESSQPSNALKKTTVDHMEFGVLEESTLEEVSVRTGNAVLEPESKNLEADDHMQIHFSLTHQVEPYIQGISLDLTDEENLMLGRGSYSQELIFHLCLPLCD